MKVKYWTLFTLTVAILSCNNSADTKSSAWEEMNPLPEAVSNNAVASVHVSDTTFLYSFMGLSAGKTYQEVHSKAFKFNALTNKWSRITDVPGDSGRLAGTAATVDGNIYIFGGYTVGKNGSEKSVPHVYRLDPSTDSYSLVTQIPVPVDDAVSVVYKDRYIYLISGWHSEDNVSNVQVFDTKTESWQQATPFPGPAVFGHAGGISRGSIVISDGVKVVTQGENSRTFEMSPESWLGKIDSDSVSKIIWTKLPRHPGPARYRMAAMGTNNKILFAGGSSNPYNYNGIGYNGEPSQPDSLLFAYSLQDSAWKRLGTAKVATMDHRSLLEFDGWYYIIGGMLKDQQVSDRVLRFRVNNN